ncbi:hypothetical protein RD792_001817 [Penstemon davidsonii]|uniref:PsbP C-terminal domain-containing protein n=1 Tax=Penstemon davidsonii TaxID=160366 RepID=A0ABR0DQ82_9LAMI|nr:hypothetical protein RD792_001817 [Penstemon davidsonii]
MTDDGKQKFRPPADQFQPLYSVFRRRFLTSVGSASLLAVGANFGGFTSFLLGFSPEASRNLKLDAIYPIGGYSRYIDTNEGFGQAAGKAEKSLDPPPLSGGGGGVRKRTVNEPEVAFGPPGSNGELNVSVIVSAVPIDFSIEAFGGAQEVGEAIVRKITGSGKLTDVKGTLIGSNVREDSVSKVKYYKLEFGVESPMFQRHNVAVCCAQNGRLFTLNAQAPESAWPQLKSQFYTIADSFYLV